MFWSDPDPVPDTCVLVGSGSWSGCFGQTQVQIRLRIQVQIRVFWSDPDPVSDQVYSIHNRSKHLYPNLILSGYIRSGSHPDLVTDTGVLVGSRSGSWSVLQYP